MKMRTKSDRHGFQVRRLGRAVVILIALAHKLLRQVWGVLKNDRPFDNDFEKKFSRRLIFS